MAPIFVECLESGDRAVICHMVLPMLSCHKETITKPKSILQYFAKRTKGKLGKMDQISYACSYMQLF